MDALSVGVFLGPYVLTCLSWRSCVGFNDDIFLTVSTAPSGIRSPLHQISVYLMGLR